MMKRFLTYLLFAFVFGNGVSQTFEIPEKPKLQTSVYDYVGLLSSSQKQRLEQKLIKYSDTTSTQIVVGIIPTTNGEYIGTLTPRWAHKWGIGQAKEDNGVFILLAKNDRKIWISSGYGVEHKLTAGVTGEIIRNVIIPQFKRGDYYSGLDNGTTAVFKVLKGTYKGERQEEFPTLFVFRVVLLIMIIIAILVYISNSKGNKNKGGGRYRRNSGDFFDTIILTNSGRSTGSFGSGGFGSSGGFGGGFGGGGFSGGGAGGSW